MENHTEEVVMVEDKKEITVSGECGVKDVEETADREVGKIAKR